MKRSNTQSPHFRGMCSAAHAMIIDPNLVASFQHSVFPIHGSSLCGFLHKHLSSLGLNFHDNLGNNDLISQFVNHIHECTLYLSSPSLIDAYNTQSINRKDHHYKRRKLVSTIGLTRTIQNRDIYLGALETSQRLIRLDTPYPPPDLWVAPSEEIRSVWYKHFKKIKLYDKRHTRKQIIVVAHPEWKRVVREDESVILRDTHNKIICIVIRNFIPHEETRAWANSIVLDTLAKKKSVRLDDPGKIVLEGYSAGALNQPMFAWAQNLLSQSYNPDQLKDMKYQSASVFALLWNVCKRLLPDEVINDYQEYLTHHNMCRMHPVTKTPGATGEYSIGKHIFRHHELAPPSGQFASNYIRYTHNEFNATEYMIAWTTNRVASEGTKMGGNFYLSDFGLLIEASQNSLVVWKPSEYHGTTLTNINPMDTDPPGFNQSGCSIALSKRLAKSWEIYLQRVLTEEEVANAFENT